MDAAGDTDAMEATVAADAIGATGAMDAVDTIDAMDAADAANAAHAPDATDATDAADATDAVASETMVQWAVPSPLVSESVFICTSSIERLANSMNRWFFLSGLELR